MGDFQRLLASWSRLVGSDLSAGGSQLGGAHRHPRLLPLQELRPQQLLEFKNKAVSSSDLSTKAQN